MYVDALERKLITAVVRSKEQTAMKKMLRKGGALDLNVYTVG